MSLDDLIETFNEYEREIRSLDKTLEGVKQQVLPPTLYHYTSASGLKGIIEDGVIWCTNLAFVNDATELSYGLTQVTSVWQQLQQASRLFAAEEMRDRILNTVDVHAACFCEKGDLLNQWYGYGLHGSGYSIGFDIQDLITIIHATDTILVNVQYDVEFQKRWIQAEINTTVAALDRLLGQNLTGRDLKDLCEHVRRQVLSNLSIIIAAMKDPVFHGEEEWRLIRYRSRAEPPREDVRFRTIGNVIVPYIPTSIRFKDTNVLPISSVIVGPTVDSLAERGVKDFLRRHQMWRINGRMVQLERSAIPLQHLS